MKQKICGLLAMLLLLSGCRSSTPTETSPMSEDENDLLDSVDDRDETSRLSCQLPFGAALDGMRVTIGADE